MSEFTVGEALNTAGFGRFQWVMALVLGVYLVADAMELMLLAVIGRAFHCQWGITDFEQASLTTVVFLSMTLAATFWGQWADMYGRLPILRLSAFFLLLFGLMTAAAPNINWVLFIRFIVGAYIGAIPQSYVAYQEYLPSKSRGRSFVLMYLFWSVGSSICILFSWLVLPTLGWRWLVALSTMPIIIFMLCSTFIPETPMFLGEAGKLMKRPSPTSRGNILDLFSEGRTGLTLQLSFMWFAYGFSYYGIALLAAEAFDDNPQKNKSNNANDTCSLNCGFTDEDYNDMLLNSLSEYPGLIMSVIMVDSIGHRWSFCISSLLATVSFFVILGYSHVKHLLLASLFVARLTWVSYTQCLVLYTPEAYPTNLRSLATGVTTVLGRLGAMLTPYVAQVLFRKSQSAAILIYLAFAASAFLASMMLPFETRGSDMTLRGKKIRTSQSKK